MGYNSAEVTRKSLSREALQERDTLCVGQSASLGEAILGAQTEPGGQVGIRRCGDREVAFPSPRDRPVDTSLWAA